MIIGLRALKLGDLLVAVPALRAIRAHWPDRRFVLACPARLRPVVELAQCVDEVLPTPGLDAPLSSRAHRPDVAVNLHGTGPRSTELLDALRPVRRIGHEGHGWQGPVWQDDLHERDRWCRLLLAHGIPADPANFRLDRPATGSTAPGAVVIHPGAAYGSKRWPADRFARVATGFAAAGHRVLFTGSAAERPLACTVARLSGMDGSAVLAGATSLVEMSALVAGAALVISGDTGVAHLAYAFGIPSVTLFGPVPARHWGPPDTGPHIALSQDDLRRGDPFADDPDPALLGVTEQEVLDAALHVLDVR